MEPACLACVGEFVQAWALIERDGVDGCVRLLGLEDADAGGAVGGTFDPVFVESLMVFRAEMDRLEADDMASEAAERRRKEAARRKK